MNNSGPYSDSFLSQKRMDGDLPADAFIIDIFNCADKKTSLYLWLNSLDDNAGFNQMPNLFSAFPFINNAGKLPIWANKKQMASGSAFFISHAKEVMQLLGLLSLPYCYAAANGAMVLYLSNRMRADVGKRLFETAEFVWDVMSPEAFESTGKGFASILKVRLMHAAARYYTLKGGSWNNEWGFPVNQEDMAGTNLSFSLMVVRGLRKFGISVSYPEQEAFMHLWNVIGYLLGLDERLLPQNGKEAFNMEESIRMRQFRQSEHGMALTASLANYFRSINSQKQFSGPAILQLMRYLLGTGAADIIGLPPSTLPFNKVQLLKATNAFNFGGDAKNTAAAYKKQYRQFKNSTPVL
jgi:hypothetical protein